MTAWLLRHWDRLQASFWFLPSLMAAGAGGLALAAVALDEAVTDDWLQRWAGPTAAAPKARAWC